MNAQAAGWWRRRWRRGAAGPAWLAAAAVLTLATLVVFTAMPEFEPVAVPWPFDPGFAAVADGTAPAPGAISGEGPAADGWQVEGDRRGIAAAGGTLRLRNDDPAGGVGVRQVWRLAPGGPRAFRLSATVASDGIRGTRDGFRVGEVTLVADGDIERPSFHPLHRLAGLRGTQAPARHVQRFRFPGSAERVELAVRLRHATGELRVGDLRLVALAERPWFAAARMALRLAWVAALAAGVWLFWRGVDHRGSALALALATGAGAVLLLMPEGLRDSTLLRLAELVPRGLGVGVDGLAALGHFLVFAAAGFLVRLSRRGDSWPSQVVLLVGAAGVAEVLQHLAELRTPTLDDWLTNACGAVLGWLPAAAWLGWRQAPPPPPAGQLATQRLSSTTVPPQAAKQRRWSASQGARAGGSQRCRSHSGIVQTWPSGAKALAQTCCSMVARARHWFWTRMARSLQAANAARAGAKHASRTPSQPVRHRRASASSGRGMSSRNAGS